MNTLYNNKIHLRLDALLLEETKTDKDVLKIYPQLKLIKNADYYFTKYSDYYCCYNYVFNDILLSEVEDAYKKLKGDYILIKRPEAKKGDILSIHAIAKGKYATDQKIPQGYNCQHFAVIHKIINDKIIIRSKFGIMGVFEGSIEDLPRTYGNIYQIWRKNHE